MIYPPDPLIDVAAIERWGVAAGVFDLMNSRWGWPTAETLHFFGMCLLIGTVGMFDLRMMGLVRGLPLGTMHRLAPFGVAGWLLCVATGFLFFVTAPGQYLYNPAFQTKMFLMAVAGVNMAAFYAVAARAAKATGADSQPPTLARVIAIVSLACWVGVIVGGRLITFFRPPYHWCVWC